MPTASAASIVHGDYRLGNLMIGPEGLADLRRRSHHPAVAIGGVKAHTLAELAGSGVEGVAVVSAICAAADVPAATRELREALATSPLQGEL